MTSNNTPLPSSFDGNTEFYEENRWQKLTRRLKEEPLIPLGCLLTCAALVGATRSIRAGDQHRTNRMFRARIAAQAFTIVAMLAGSMYWEDDRKKRKEFEGVVEERKKREKNEAWIRELEARDEEEREIRRVRERRRVRREGRKAGQEEGKEVGEEVVEEGSGNGMWDGLVEIVGGKGKSNPELAKEMEEKVMAESKGQKTETTSQPPNGSSPVVEGSKEKRSGVLEKVQELVGNQKK